MTHWRSSCENPRSTWIDGSATFTTAMSRTTMNWTVQSSASASHLRREAFTSNAPFPIASTRLRSYSVYFQIASRHSLLASGGATLRFVAKRFDQYCPIAHALSLVGERWALLVVRELMRGPKRYTDLS